MWSVPLNRFEWMLHTGDVAGFCNLPLDDSEPALEAFVYLLPMLALAGIAAVIAVNRRGGFPRSLFYAGALVGLWAWRFLIDAPRCPVLQSARIALS